MFLFLREHVRLNAMTVLGIYFTCPSETGPIENILKKRGGCLDRPSLSNIFKTVWTMLNKPSQRQRKAFRVVVFFALLLIAQLPLWPPLLTVTSCICPSCTQIEFPILFLPQRTLSGHVEFCPAENESDGSVWGLIDCSTTQQITMWQLKLKKKSN